MIILLKFLAGMLIGIANVIPGVSGGTIAVILHAYEDLLTLTSLNFKKIFANIKVMIALCVGAVAGIFLFAKVVNAAYEKFPVYTNFFFTGIILGSIPFLFQLMKDAHHAEETRRRKIIKVIFFVVAFALMLLLFFAQRNMGSIQNGIVALDFKQGIVLFFVGVIAAIAMIVPGISGSFVLLVLGYYETVINAVSSFNIPVLAIFACGVLLGLVSASRFLIFVLEKHGDIVYSFIFALVLGSVLQILPLVKQSLGGFVISGISLLAGASLILCFTFLNKKSDNLPNGHSKPKETV